MARLATATLCSGTQRTGRTAQLDFDRITSYEVGNTALATATRGLPSCSGEEGERAAQGKKGCLIDVCVRTDKETRRRCAEATGPEHRKDTQQRGMGRPRARRPTHIAVFNGNLEARCISGSSADKHRHADNRMRLPASHLQTLLRRNYSSGQAKSSPSSEPSAAPRAQARSFSKIPGTTGSVSLAPVSTATFLNFCR